MTAKTDILQFASDYMEGAHPNILKKLLETNFMQTAGYGFDPYTQEAKEKIRTACHCPDADIFFLIGGTQTNATVIDAVLASYEGILSPDSGHISVHEAGAIELSGHKVLPLPQQFGKITAETIESAMVEFQNDANHDHMVQPGMVYISQPTEYGTLYSLDELTRISNVCHNYGLVLYVDGARLAYALASRQNDVSLSDLARLCDIFYIGGTKCGALFGEAVVIPQHDRIPHFFTIIKQHGALLAKGRILGIQFDELFRDDLYLHIGEPAICYAEKIKEALQQKGYQLYFDSPTNQIFIILDNERMDRLEAQVAFSFWETYDATHTIIRLATSWATQAGAVEKLIALL